MVLQRLKKTQTPGVLEEKPIILGIKGHAGFGKSRLVYEFLTSIHEARCILYGTTPRVAQNPYCVFISMIKYYLDISQIDSPQTVKEKLETGIQELEASLNDEVEVQNLHGILPMVGFLLGVKYDDIRLQLKGKELQPHLQIAIRYFLEAVAAKANRIGAPLLVIWEDLQWLDEVSRTTLDVLIQTLNLEKKRKQQDFKHFMFVFTYRPEYNVPEAVKSESDFSEIELMPLDEYNAEALIQSMVGEITLPTTVKQQVMEKSEGNPFYLEEWANLVSEMPSFDNGGKALPVPSSLTALVLSRIDRLEHDLKLLLQKAAVIGKEFFVKILEEIEKKLNRPEDISEQLSSLETGDFIRRTFGSKYSAYFFKHLITHEVAYNTLLIANRKILHRITAEVIEEQFAENIEEFYYELAEHYSKAEILNKTIEYLEKAGDKAKANYNNEKAVEFYDRLLLNLKGFENLSGLRIDILLKKGEVLQITGKWNDCKHAYAEALRGAGKIDDSRRMGESHWALSVILRLQGSYEGAMAHCERSLALFQTVDDQMGVSKAVGNMGNVHLLKSDYEAAMACYEKSLTIKEALGDKAGISYDIGNMGGVYYDTGNYEAAVACYEKKFRICGELGDKLGISRALGYMGNVYYSKGDYEFAIVYYEKDLELCEELGDKLGISKAVGNMGNVYYNQGDYETAMACYERSLKICKELGYKMGISASAGIMGFVHRDQGNYETAMTYFEKVLTIQEELGDKRGLSASLGNMGVIYHNKGDYDAAVTCFERALRIREKLEYKKGISLAVNHMGIIYKDKGDYETAIAYYDRAIKIGRALGINPFLCGYLMNKAEVLYLQQRFDEARVLSLEGLQIAGEVGRKETVFQGKVLLARIDFALGHQEKTVTLLSRMLTQTENKVEKADLHYELHQCGVEREEHRKEALQLYQELYTKTPKFEWKKRIEELEITS
jgi:tetratricopeptide (TPR) repeat protein